MVVKGPNATLEEIESVYRRDGAAFERVAMAWLWRIVVNAALAGRDARPTQAELHDDLVGFDENGADETGVRAWVASLPERQRIAVFLRYYADLDYRGIAAALGIEVGTVSATLSAAHSALRRSLQEVER